MPTIPVRHYVRRVSWSISKLSHSCKEIHLTMTTNEEVRKYLFTEGDKIRRKVLGDAHVDRCKDSSLIEV